MGYAYSVKSALLFGKLVDSTACEVAKTIATVRPTTKWVTRNVTATRAGETPRITMGSTIMYVTYASLPANSDAHSRARRRRSCWYLHRPKKYRKSFTNT